MNLVDALLRWLFQLPPLQAMRLGARSLLEFTLLALIDPETLAPRTLTDDYLRFLHGGVGTAATLIGVVVGARAAELAGLPECKRSRGLPELRCKPCDQVAMIRRVCDLLHRLDCFEAAAVRLARRMKAAQDAAQCIGRIAGLPADEPAPAGAEQIVAPNFAFGRALELSG